MEKYIIHSKKLYGLNLPKGDKFEPYEKCRSCSTVENIGDVCITDECEVKDD